MIKRRFANYCNLKLLLLFFIVYGHFIEPYIESSRILEIQYKCIYFFHMPLFIFLSGLFLNCTEDCIKQLKKLLPIYITYQLGMVCLGVTDIKTPWWILWYLFSYCVWTALASMWFKINNKGLQYGIITIVILGGILSGYVQFLGRIWSGSRIVVFLPYFLMGLVCNYKMSWQKYRILGIVAGFIAAALIVKYMDLIPVDFLYHANGFGKIQNGLELRMVCYIVGTLSGLFLLTNIPQVRFPFTKAGADTLIIYLLHGPIVYFLRKIDCHWVLYSVWSIAYIYFAYKIQQWNGKLYYVKSFCDDLRIENSNR